MIHSLTSTDFLSSQSNKCFSALHLHQGPKNVSIKVKFDTTGYQNLNKFIIGNFFLLSSLFCDTANKVF